ncbi:MAG: TetR/AcrR family transcriptional regulator [Micrococcales bacterium]|nr:TetR/AcrR family transcriptional regulator [Micrococcales bacterium]
MRRAVLDASATLFAERGVDGVSLRDIASQANVHLDLIRQYIGNRHDLIHATFDDLSEQLAVEILEHPLEGHGFDRERVIVKWARVMGSPARQPACTGIADRKGHGQGLSRSVLSEREGQPGGAVHLTARPHRDPGLWPRSCRAGHHSEGDRDE